MKTQLKIKIAALVMLSLIIFSCKKSGCTDPSALNYSSGAELDDGSCFVQSDLSGVGSLNILVEEFNATFGPSSTAFYTPSFQVHPGDVIILEVETGTTVKMWSSLPYMLGNNAYIEGKYSDDWSGIQLSSFYASGNIAIWSSPTTFKFRAALLTKAQIEQNPGICLMSINKLTE